MAARSSARKRGWGLGWLATLLALLLMVFGGFGVGLVVGFVLEEPTLVAGHIVGRTTEIDWGPENARASTPGAGEAGALAPVGAGPSPAFLRAQEEALRFSIQVGAFGNPARASDLAEQLGSAGYPVQILEPDDDDRWRVRVGPIDSRNEADTLALRLKREDRLPTWVLSEPRD